MVERVRYDKKPSAKKKRGNPLMVKGNQLAKGNKGFTKEDRQAKQYLTAVLKDVLEEQQDWERKHPFVTKAKALKRRDKKAKVMMTRLVDEAMAGGDKGKPRVGLIFGIMDRVDGLPTAFIDLKSQSSIASLTKIDTSMSLDEAARAYAEIVDLDEDEWRELIAREEGGQ